MRQPSSWLVALALALLATFVLQTDPDRVGPFVDVGRFLARTTLVGVVTLCSWRLLTVARGWARQGDRRRRAGGLLAVSVGVVVVGIVLGFFGYGNALAGVVVVLVGVAGALSVVVPEPTQEPV